MKDGFFLVGLGLATILIGLMRTASRILRKDMPKSTGYLRGQEVASYVVIGFGALLALIGIVAIVIELVS